MNQQSHEQTPDVAGSSAPVSPIPVEATGEPQPHPEQGPQQPDIRSTVAVDPAVHARRCAELLFDEPGRVVELRALDVKTNYGSRIVSGYFDDPKAFVAAALKLDGRASGVYATLNPVNRDLLARSANATIERPKSTTGDTDIEGRRFVLIDIDPRRPSGISSSNEELGAARQLAKDVAAYLAEQGFPEPAKAISGNGAHILYRVDLPTDDGGLVKSFLAALAFKFNTDDVQVDETVHNPARLLKVYGTQACKGSNIPERPHRRSGLWLPAEPLQVAPPELLQRVAADAPKAPASASPAAMAEGKALDVGALLARSGMAVASHGPWNGGQRWVLETCPFNAEHTNRSAYVIQFPSGAIGAGCHHNTCTGKGWHELRDILDPGWRDRRGASGGSDGGGGGRLTLEWGEPEPIPDELLPVLTVPQGDVPDALRPWLVDIAERVNCPLDFLVVGAYVGLASLVGRKVGIRPNRYDDWLVVPNLWGGIIGRPGVLKSPALRQVLLPMRLVDGEVQQRYQAEYDSHEAGELAWELKRKKLGGKQLDKMGDEELESSARQLLAERPKAPPKPRRIVNDSTVEKLGEILRDNPNGVLVFRDELPGLLRSLEKDGHEQDRAFYLEAWDGMSSFTFDRVARGTVPIPSVVLSVLGGIQPGPLLSYMQAQAKSGTGDDGLMQRFQLLVWPDTAGEWRNVDRWPDADSKRQAYDVYTRLERLSAADVGAEQDPSDPNGIPWLHFDEAAQVRFHDWRAELERYLANEAESESLESHFAKYRSLVPSLALVFHLVDGGSGPVGLSPLERAISFEVYLRSHAARIYGAALDPATRTARLLSQKLKTGKLKSPFRLRDVYQNGWSGLNDSEEVRRAAERLEDHCWLRSEEVKTTGRPARVFHINPRVLEMDPGETVKTTRSSSTRPEGAKDSDAGAREVDRETADDGWEGVA